MTLTKEEERMMKAIGSTEETTFKEFCVAMGDDCPDGTEGWREAFARLRKLERAGMVGVIRKEGRIEGMILTKQGADHIRDLMDADRGLLR